MAGLLISCPFPITTHHPFLYPPFCFLNTLDSEPELLSEAQEWRQQGNPQRPSK